MKKNIISLDKFIELTEKAVSDANKRMITDYISETKKNPDIRVQGMPMIVSKMKVTFSAAVDAYDINNSDIYELNLDFGKQGGFCGEFEVHTNGVLSVKHLEGSELNEHS